MNTKEIAQKTSKMVNIVSKMTKKGKVYISLEESKDYYLPLDKDPMDLSDDKIRNMFIKSVETNVRTSKLYKAYISYLKEDCGLDKCSIYGNIQSKKKGKTKVEMHHGPIFTLYDYVSIVINKHIILKSDKLNTYDIAAEVLDLHRRKLVQTVMLSESVHKSIDNKKMAPFLSMDQTFGDIVGFVREYGKYFSPSHRNSLKSYFFNYKSGLQNKKINMFMPIMTKYNISIKENPNKEIT